MDDFLTVMNYAAAKNQWILPYCPYRFKPKLGMRMLTEKCVLVVDDDPKSLEVMKRYLPHFGVAKVLLASNGHEAIDILRSEHVDLVIIDIMMPRLNGYALATQIKQELKLTHIPLIAITSQGMFEPTPEADAAGIEVVLPKPFNHCRLREILQQYL